MASEGAADQNQQAVERALPRNRIHSLAITIDNIISYCIRWKKESVSRKILAATLIVGLMGILGRLSGLAKELVVAGWFGVGDALDAYLIGLLVPTFVVNIIGASFASAVIPTYIHVRDNEGPEAAQRLLSQLLTLSIVLLGAAVMLAVVFVPRLLPVLGSSFDQNKLALTRSLFYWSVPIVFTGGIAGMLTSIINASERFALPALLPAMMPLSAIAVLVAFGGTFGIFALAAGTVLGSAIQVVALAGTLRARGMSLRPSWSGLNGHTRLVAGQFGAMLAGACIHGISPMVDQSMAAMLAPGSVSALNYGGKLVDAFLGLTSMAFGTALMPYLGRLTAAGNVRDLIKTVRTYGSWILLLGVPTALALFAFSEPLVRLVYLRGAFRAEDLPLVAKILGMYSFQIPFYFLTILGAKLLSADLRNRTIMKIAVVNAVANITLNYLLMKYMGLAGIALSTSMVCVMTTVLVFASLYPLLIAQASESPQT